MYDIIIIGAGPAGLTAALYAGRAEKSVLVIEKESFGGQITQSPRVENYPGFEVISGNELADRLIEQVFAQGVEIELDEVLSVEGSFGEYKVVCKGKNYECRTVIIAAGSHHRALGIEGEEALVGHGISYCAVCDGAFYKGKRVAVIGGGNSALVDAVMLAEYCEKVYIIQNLPHLTGEKRLANLLSEFENVEIILSTTVKSFVTKDGELCGLKLSGGSGEYALDVDGIFVAIGQMPENEPFAGVANLNEQGYIISDESCMPKGSADGIFVAGDCRTKCVRQVSTATADGAVAALAACKLLDNI